MKHLQRTSDDAFQEGFCLPNNCEIYSSIGAYGRFIFIYGEYSEAVSDGYLLWDATYGAATIWDDLAKLVPISESVGCPVGDLAIEGWGVSLLVPSYLPHLVCAEGVIAPLLLGIGCRRRGGLLWFRLDT